ncbi:MAG: LamG domain-containing protein [Terracidiphilus sp.]
MSQRGVAMKGLLKGFAVIAAGAMAMAPSLFAQSQNAPQAELWRFDNIDSVGGHPTHVLGHPHLIDSPYGKAIEFNGVDDALFVDVHPLAGASAYTWEVIFRPDADGAQAQRFFHLSEIDPATGTDTENRMLFEIRIVKGQWCLDSFADSNGSARTLLNCDKLYPLGQWYRVTAVYDGKMLRNYVGGELQGEGELHLTPQRAGHSSIGTRINRRDYFKGAIFEAHFTPRALTPEEFLPMPPVVGDGTAK